MAGMQQELLVAALAAYLGVEVKSLWWMPLAR